MVGADATSPVAATVGRMESVEDFFAYVSEAHCGAPLLLMAIPPGQGKPSHATVRTASAAAAWAEVQGQTCGVYVHVNPVRAEAARGWKGKSTLSAVECVAFLHVDIDPRVGEDREQERARILQLINGWRLKPTICVDSGNGFQCWYRLRQSEATRLDGSKERADELGRYNQRIAIDLTGDSTHDVSRILRVPFLTNFASAKKRAKGRVDAPTSVVAFNPDAVYDLRDFTPAAAPGQRSTVVRARGVDGVSAQARPAASGRTGVDELQAWAKDAGKAIDDLTLAYVATGAHPIEPNRHGGDRSAAVFAATCGLVRAGVPDALIVGVLTDSGNAISGHVLDQPGDRLVYAQRQVDRARDVVSSGAAANGRDAMEAARRAYQVEENRRIGDGSHSIPTAEVVDLDTALARFVFCADGSRVVDVFNPHYDLPLHDWQATYAASKVAVARPPKVLAGGAVKEQEPASVPMTKIWVSHEARRTVVTRTFRADGALVLPDPQGRLAVNSWRPFDRSRIVDDLATAGLGLFVDHVAFLFGADTDRFLDWLAHIEQKPGELPHTSWLHIARKFGMGRNWLASVLTRVWAGSIAPNFDLVATLKSGFNGGLSRKVLAIVDEIREGGRDAQWEHSEKMKSLITEETRTVNPKYGRQSVEYNACRWLMFSNHLSAIPLENGDRRIEVVVTEAAPQSADYYTALYRALNAPDFIAAVATFLGRRNLAAFNPGAHARLSAAKREAIQASQSPDAYWAELIAAHWPCDIASNRDVASVFNDSPEHSSAFSAAHRRALQAADVVPLGTPVRLRTGPTRVHVIRNKERWKNAQPRELVAEWARCEALTDASRWQGWRLFLLGVATGHDVAGCEPQVSERLPF